MRALLLCILYAVTLTAMAQIDDDSSASQVQVRTYLEPEGEYYVGQLVKYWVEITTPDTFVQAPRYPDLKIDGAIALMPEQLGVNFSSREKGKSIIGQRQRYAIIPQRTGELMIPALKITLATKDSSGATNAADLVTDSVTLETRLPPGAETVPQLVTTTSLIAQQTYSQDSENLKVGDAVTRTIMLMADNMLAIALPAIQFQEIAGASVYPVRPELDDEINRGQYSAKRTDAATYMLEHKGTVNFPEIRIEWWNLDTEKLEVVVLPEASFTVSANADVPTEIVTQVPEDKLKYWLGFALEWIRLNITWLGLTAIGSYIVILGWRKYGPVLTDRITHRWRLLKHSEGLAFLKFRLALRFGSSDRASALFWRWLEFFSPTNRVASVGELAAEAGDHAFSTFFEKFESARYDAQGVTSYSVSKIDRRVREFRKRLQDARQPNHQHGSLNRY